MLFPKTCPVRRGHFGKTFRFMFFRITKHQKRRGCLLWIRAGYRCDVLLTCLRLFQLYKDRRWTVSPPPEPRSRLAKELSSHKSLQGTSDIVTVWEQEEIEEIMFIRQSNDWLLTRGLFALISRFTRLFIEGQRKWLRMVAADCWRVFDADLWVFALFFLSLILLFQLC